MRLYRFRSFFSLILTGFIFVSLPLVTALFSSVQILDGLVQQSAVAVYRSVNRVESSRKVIDLLHNQERKARLYHVLGEPVYLDDVNMLHAEIGQILAQFAALDTDNDLIPLIEQLQAKEDYLIAALNKVSGSPELRRHVQEAILALYSEIEVIASQLESLSNTLMIDEVDILEEKVQLNKRTLAWQVSGLIGFSVLLIFLFASLIIRPVSQMDKGIERLGEGDFSTPIKVSGSKDLEALGEKLDWLRKRLDKLDREKVKMIAHISHELKTPLSSIKEGAGLLKDGLVGPLSTSQEEVVSILDKNCAKLENLIKNILDFNMAEAREVPVDIEEVQLDQVVKEVTGDHHNSILARKIIMDMNLEPAKVEGSRKQLKTVVDNLLGNAIKFTPDEGMIKIYQKVKNNKVRLVVEDNGPGISEEDRPQIFLPFFKGGQKNRSGLKGSGLGLAIAKEYVQNCGGTLRLLPSSRGARFSIVLPRIKGAIG